MPALHTPPPVRSQGSHPKLTVNRRCGIAMAVVLMSLGSSAWGQAIDKATLDQVKDATVFVKLSAGKLQGSGSGFVIRTTTDTVLVLTNRHVAAPSPDELPEKAAVELRVVLRSGTPQEEELPARVLAYDDREVRDLAVLEVRGVHNPPRPILADQTATEADFIETMPAYALGFPLGGRVQQIADNLRQNPAITVIPMTIGSLRRDEANRLARVQLNGAMIEGNSGGPIVDPKGRLVGVAVSRVRNEAVGFAIPPSVISGFLAGDVGGHTAEVVQYQGTSPQVSLKLRLVDPLSKVRGVAVRYARQANAAAPKPDPKGAPSLLPGGTSVPLSMKEGTAAGQFGVPVSTAEDRKLLVQFVVTDLSGTVRFSKPVPVTLPEKPGVITGWSEDSDRPKTLAKWSCQSNIGEGVKMAHQPGATTIDLAGGAPLINAPQYRLFTAPCAMVRVQGDFVAVVKVTNDFDPGGDVLTLPNKAKAKMTFQGAGLLVWQDERNFIRLERCKGSLPGLELAHRILVEVYKGGKEAFTSYMNVPEGPIALVVVRKGGSVQFLFAIPPGKNVVFREMPVDFSHEVLVGVAATNLSKRPFQAKFEDFTLKTLEGKEFDVKPVALPRLAGGGSERRADGTWVMEGATMKVVKTVGGNPAVPQPNMDQFKGVWSDNRQLVWSAAKMGEALTLEVPVEADGKYELKAVFTTAPDYARVRLALDDKTLTPAKDVDLFGKVTRPSGAMSLGTHTLKKGIHRLTVHVLGKNPSSSGYHFGLDELQLAPAR
jgi:S1-C subfamily serine protease/regulation of enolase protein 1 (concanavalin A-like superfamily)